MNITTLWCMYMQMRLITTIIETIVACRILGNNDSATIRLHGHGGVDVALENATVVVVDQCCYDYRIIRGGDDVGCVWQKQFVGGFMVLLLLLLQRPLN